MSDVLIVGAGPVGLLLGSELARLGVSTTLVEARSSPGTGTRAIGVHAPVLAALEASGVTERLLAGAVRVSRGEARSDGRLIGTVHFERLNTRFPFVATLPQSDTETALSLGAPPPLRGERAVRVSVGAGSVAVALESGELLSAPLVVVAGGWASRGLVYRAPEAFAYRDRYVMTDIPAPPSAHPEVATIHLDRDGVLESFPLPGGWRRFVAWAPSGSTFDAADRLRDALRARGEHAAADATTAATGFGVRRFTARAMRRDRLFVVGDAAHEVSPIGGQGMNLGLLDAATLAPLLARWVHSGEAPESELHRWERDRILSARRAARLAAVNTGLGRPRGPLTNPLRRAAVRLALTPPADRALAWAYAMGLDRAA